MNGLVKIILFGVSARCSVALLSRISFYKKTSLIGRQISSSSASLSTSASAVTISTLRKEYSSQPLIETDVAVQQGPIALFTSWLTDACNAKVLEPNAMCLSTCRDNKPSARMVLLKGFDSRGFVWYTNYESRKGSELEKNPNACLTFWWGDLERSVRIEGIVEKVSNEESDSYFQIRPRNGQLGAWSSHQSSPIENRESLESQEQEVVKKFEGIDKIPRPPHWGGYRLVPVRMEFWKGRESRLHDRLSFERSDIQSDLWKLIRLQP